MALVIRLRQNGKKNRQSYRLVVTDRRSPRDGKYVEMLGWYNPFSSEDKSIKVDAERVFFWANQGAIISERVESLLAKAAPDVILKLAEKKKAKKLKRNKKSA